MNKNFTITGLNHWNALKKVRVVKSYQLYECSLMPDGSFAIGGYYN